MSDIGGYCRSDGLGMDNQGCCWRTPEGNSAVLLKFTPKPVRESNHVVTTPGTQQDSDVTADIYADLAQVGLLPSEHFVDEGYTDASLVVESQEEHGIELYGPVARNGSWQAIANQGFDQVQFTVDWDAKQVTCPQGKVSIKWVPIRDVWKNEMIHVQFRRSASSTPPLGKFNSAARTVKPARFKPSAPVLSRVLVRWVCDPKSSIWLFKWRGHANKLLNFRNAIMLVPVLKGRYLRGLRLVGCGVRVMWDRQKRIYITLR